MELDVKRSELASQRIAFEEEKLARLSSEVHATDSEAEALRLKLKEQVIDYYNYCDYANWTQAKKIITILSFMRFSGKRLSVVTLWKVPEC